MGVYHGLEYGAEVTSSGLPDAGMTQGPLIVQRTPPEASNCTSRQLEATTQKAIQEALSCLPLWRCINVAPHTFPAVMIRVFPIANKYQV